MELLAAGAARVRNDEDFAWIVAGKQDGLGQGARRARRGALGSRLVWAILRRREEIAGIQGCGGF